MPIGDDILVRLLATTLRARGHRLVLNTRGGRPRLSLRLEKAQHAVRIIEERDRVRHVPTDDERRRKRHDPWIRPPEYDDLPSGRLRLEINRAGHNTCDTWSDDKRANLEHRLRKIIREVEQGYLADEREREERERAWREQLERWEQQTRRNSRSGSRPRGTLPCRHGRKLRTDRFKAAYDGWSAAEAIREFCAVLENHTSVGEQAGRNLARWAAWVRHKADLLDPTVNLSVLADVDFGAEPTPRDLSHSWANGVPPNRPGPTVPKNHGSATPTSAPTRTAGTMACAVTPRHGDGAGKANSALVSARSVSSSDRSSCPTTSPSLSARTEPSAPGSRSTRPRFEGG